MAVKFRKYLKNVSSEIHFFKGFLRFKESFDGYLYANFKPNNDLLLSLMYHFKNRIPNEKFVIFDEGCKKCRIYLNGDILVFLVDDFLMKNEDKNRHFEEYWKEFYKSISIDNRENLKLMQSNMPKKYWKYLPEKDE